jgi:hypothetical protein
LELTVRRCRPGRGLSAGGRPTVSELPLQPGDDQIECILDPGSVRVGAERVARNGQRGLDRLRPVVGREVLGDDLHLHPGRPWFQSLELLQLVLSELPKMVGDAEPSALEDEVHRHLLRRRERRVDPLDGAFPPWEA